MAAAGGSDARISLIRFSTTSNVIISSTLDDFDVRSLRLLLPGLPGSEGLSLRGGGQIAPSSDADAVRDDWLSRVPGLDPSELCWALRCARLSSRRFSAW